MAKFRTNHARQGGQSGKMMVRVGMFAAIVTGLFYFFQKYTGIDLSASAAAPEEERVDGSYDGPENGEYYLPRSSQGEVVEHRYYALSYDEENEQAEWVAYVLTRERLDLPWVDRADEFTEDPAVSTGSATLADYSGSGYDRGHLVPAADMAFSEEAMQETFYLSNISPQARNFNQGIWRELEEQTRNWAKKYAKLYVVSGPVLTKPGKGQIGRNKVTIPSAYFKVLLDLTEPELKAIAFVIPNEVSYDPLFKYARPVDEVEKLTGIDFFPGLMTPGLEEELESNTNIDLWSFSKEKFEERVREWNNQ